MLVALYFVDSSAKLLARACLVTLMLLLGYAIKVVELDSNPIFKLIKRVAESRFFSAVVLAELSFLTGLNANFLIMASCLLLSRTLLLKINYAVA